jgi:ribosomal protein L12E/L44/L45/RPP1/RPP2
VPRHTERVLSTRRLNRTLLERQLLLRRDPRGVVAAVEHLVGMQCQEPPAPFYGLWSRLEGFESAELVRLLEDHAVMRTTLMRATLHLTTADDFLAWRPMHQAMLEKRFAGSGFAKQLDGVDVREVVEAGRAVLAQTPGTTAQIGRALAQRWPEHDSAALAYAVRFIVPLAQLPPRGTSLERQGGQAVVAPVEELLGRPLAAETAPDALLLRYLAAFGPSSVADMRLWSGLPGLASAVERLRPRLRSFRDERGRELLDLPDAPIATGDEPAPPRFLPWFDNILLGHDDRSRVLPHGHRLGVVGGNAFVLVDGFARATWRIERSPEAATLRVQPLEPLGDVDEIVAEGERLLAFAAPAAERRDVAVARANGNGAG